MDNVKVKFDFLIKIFDNQQTLIFNADSKANIALGIQSFITTTILGASFITDIFKTILNLNEYIKISYCLLFVFFIIFSIIGICISICVFIPRLPQESKELKRDGITYFGHIVEFINSNDYLKKINDLDIDEILKELSYQNYNLAIILEKKMKCVKQSIIFLFLNIILGFTLLIFSLIIK